jgi:lipoate-protein ligase A
VFDCRLIIDPPTLGAHNMAVDEALLVHAAEHNTAALRFYSWSEPTLSLGYFQRYADRHQHPASLACAVVRRQTGGGAILHDRELTYSLVLPASHPLTKRNEELYRIVHEVFIDVMSPPGEVHDSVRELQFRGDTTRIAPGEEPFLCFQRQSPGDVVFFSSNTLESNASSSQSPAPPAVKKILGSAQRRYRGALLQHGSLLLECSSAAPELKGLHDLAGTTVEIEDVISTAARQLGPSLRLEFHEAKLPKELELKAVDIANNKYRSDAWTKRR